MDTVIALCISVVGSYFCGLDFCTLYTLISIICALMEFAVHHSEIIDFVKTLVK